MTRRLFLQFMGRSALLPVAGQWLTACVHSSNSKMTTQDLPFQPVPPTQQDAVILPSGYSYELLISEGEALNLKGLQFGSHCDYTSFVSLAGKPNEGILWVNHESVDPFLFSSWDHKYPRKKDQVLREQTMVGGSLIKIEKSTDSDQWRLQKNHSLNRRLDARTPIPLIADRPISGKKMAVGTVANCAGGRTPWGTVLTCEENYDKFYGEMDYSGPTPRIGNIEYGVGWGTVISHSPEHYGWVVEVDPFSSKAHKLCALGRFAHECATCVTASDGRVVVYMGDDAPDEFIYKFVSAKPGSLTKGTLFVANTELGRWLPLDIRSQGKLRDKFKDQTEVLIRAREAAALLGATPQDRPEDIEIDPATGHILIAVTNNKKKGNPYGSILKIIEKDNNPLAIDFESKTFLAGGAATGFACPDNLAFDRKGNLWFTIDIAESDLGKSNYQQFGNNALFYVPMSGPSAGQALRFASAPTNAEFTGPSFSPDGKTLFLSVQHPGEGSRDIQNPISHWPLGGSSLPKSSVITIDVSRLI